MPSSMSWRYFAGLAATGAGKAAARRELPPFFDTTQFRAELDALGLDPDALTTENDRTEVTGVRAEGHATDPGPPPA
jgi:hypothetical protein